MAKFDKTYCSQCGGEFGPGDHGFSHCFNHCSHEWHEVESQSSNEKSTTVRCDRCGVPGEQDIETRDVFYPAT